MKDFEVERNTNLKFKCTALAILGIAFIVAFIPLWQLGVDNTMRIQAMASEVTLNELDTEERALKAYAFDLEDNTDGSVILVQARL